VTAESSDPAFRIEALSSHDRSAFCCGNDRIDKYFREVVTQDIKRGYANCFVAIEIKTGRLAGFYTLTSNSIPLTEIPDDLKKKLPRYPTVPIALIGWLGRHVDFKRRGLGDVLLFDAIKTIATAPIASHAIVVDAIDDAAIEFYRAYGFVSLAADRANRMYLPVATALKAIAD
jgi:ribosomal protein S18 acetylase RimI-like enzyme